MKKLASKERLLRTIKGEPTDHIPVYAPIPRELPMIAKRGYTGWQAEPNFQTVATFALEHCDFFCRMNSIGSFNRGLLDRRFLLIPDEHIQVSKEKEGARTTSTYMVRTPKGDLRYVETVDDNIATTWVAEPLLKDKDDVEKLLSAPFSFDPPDLEAYRQEVADLGDAGLPLILVTTPLECVSHLLEFQQFLMWCALERPAIVRLIEAAFERIYIKLEWLLQNKIEPTIRFAGSEQATPPMMSLQYFEELSARYDRALFELVHKYDGIVHVHCHGKVKEIFPRLLDMGVDVLDPMEPPPDGDLTLAEAQRMTGGRMTLIGGLEFRDFELCTPDEIEVKTKEAIDQGGRTHYVLGPSAVAMTYICDRFRDNVIRFIETGLDYGK
jgi:uroporphyrinogen-III decarboxylase